LIKAAAVDGALPTLNQRRRLMGNPSKEEKRQKVIEVLNKARAMELLAIYQYMNQHYNLDDLDYGELAGKIKLIAIDERNWAVSRSPNPTAGSRRVRRWR
jgi:hypothetical protein